MAEVNAIPFNGFNVVSTFSGGGGSSLGYRMAGFKVLWASEFVEAARDTYTANFPTTHVDDRDIRDVKAEDVLKDIGMEVGELDLLDGSPPCSAFSMAGSREKGWGKVKTYSDKSQRVDDLFFEYARLVKGIQPKVFVAENVAGLVAGTAKGYFKEIMAELKACGYNVKAVVLDARWLGVPQARRRLIFVGVRNDLGLAPAFPSPFQYSFSIRDVLPHLAGKLEFDSGFQSGKRVDFDGPMPTVMAGGVGGSNITQLHLETDVSEVDGTGSPYDLDAHIMGVRYDTEALDRQRVIHDTSGFVRDLDVTDKPSPCIIASGPAHYHVTIPGSRFRRKLTIPELRCICSFPDDFILTGSYAKQWERMGRAVPPLMMREVAAIIRDKVLACVE